MIFFGICKKNIFTLICVSSTQSHMIVGRKLDVTAAAAAAADAIPLTYLNYIRLYVCVSQQGMTGCNILSKIKSACIRYAFFYIYSGQRRYTYTYKQVQRCGGLCIDNNVFMVLMNVGNVFVCVCACATQCGPLKMPIRLVKTIANIFQTEVGSAENDTA